MRKLFLVLVLTLLRLPLAAQSQFYVTSFDAPPAPQNPISEGSQWLNGAANGTNWTDCRTAPGFAYGTQPGNASGIARYADSTCVLTGTWTQNQAATAVLKVPTQPSSAGGVFTELELRLNTTITSGTITGYEFNISVANGNAYAQIVRWDGGLGSFTQLNGSTSVPLGVTGTVLKATNVNGTLTLYVNGSPVETATDSTYTHGSPGIGMFLQGTTGINANYGFSSFAAVDSTSLLANSTSSTDVCGAISSASGGEAVVIPAGTSLWASGCTWSGKGITLAGNGSGRIVAYSSDTLTVGTGSKTINVTGYSPGFSSSVLAVGQVVDIMATGFEASFAMHGTVTGLSSGVLTVNVASVTGSGSTHRWEIATQPTTVLVNNTSAGMFNITEDSTVNTRLSGFKIQAGSGTGNGVTFSYNSTGQAIVLQNCWIQQGSGDSMHFTTNRGVISKCTFDSPTFSMTPIALHIKMDAPASGQITWTQPSYWGTADTTGQHNIYVETSDFEAYLNATDNDDNGRLVFRYNLMNNAGFGTHGADTSQYGQRYFEYYNNRGVFNPYSDGTTFNMNWWMYVRGGTYVVHDNNLDNLVSQDYGTKLDINYTTMNLQRNGGLHACWGQGTSGGVDYYAPRQVGMGRVTGTGTTSGNQINCVGTGCSSSTFFSGGTDSATYVGDSEPAYIWNNQATPLPNVNFSNYGGTDCTSPDTTANYVVLNRDYFNGSTAKPGYTPYTYPHPLVGGSGPPPPTGLTGTVNVSGSVPIS